MHVLALLARKGGAGKTTIAVHMGVQAQAGGRRVLFCDLDPQHSLGGWWRLRQAAAPELVETDARQLPGVLRSAAADGVDLVVLDTPPAVGFDTLQVAKLAALVLIPLRPSILDIQAVASTADVVRSTDARALLLLNACPSPRGTAESSVAADARSALAGYPVPVARNVICDRRDFARALNGGEAVNEFAPASKAAAEMRRLWAEVEGNLI
ncbi:MAG: ParA family protein [Acetobacteraceae bacterium]|nr:ParA family protein [Acetobacteraceae bacterium]